jgi:hypothetical protein
MKTQKKLLIDLLKNEGVKIVCGKISLSWHFDSELWVIRDESIPYSITIRDLKEAIKWFRRAVLSAPKWLDLIATFGRKADN